MEKIEIGHLKDYPQYLETIAIWIYNEWWTDKPEVTIASMKQRLLQAKTDVEIPLSLIALVDGKPAGTVNFIESDNSEFPELSPWLAALLVHPTYRRRGVASKLVNRFIDHAREFKISEFYLGTDIPNFYEPFGARIHAEGSKNLKIMKFDLASRTTGKDSQ